MRQLNHTFITLVLKDVGAEMMGQFHPISCINSLYKIHAKIIVDQLAMVVPNLISGNQAAFMGERHIEEQFKLAKEMTRSFGQKSTPRRFCMTVDLRKAFDTLSWSAIDATLAVMGFSEEVRQMLDQCYCTTSFSVLCDDEPMARFESQRELRQGDPISPLLFNIAMENLTQIRNKRFFYV